MRGINNGFEDREGHQAPFTLREKENIQRPTPNAQRPEGQSASLFGEAATTGDVSSVAGANAGTVNEQVIAPLDRGPVAVRRGQDALIDVVVRTRKVGHAFPGGTFDAFDVWVELEAIDDRGNLLATHLCTCSPGCARRRCSPEGCGLRRHRYGLRGDCRSFALDRARFKRDPFDVHQMQWRDIIGSHVAAPRSTTKRHRWWQRRRKANGPMRGRRVDSDARRGHFAAVVHGRFSRASMNAGSVAHASIMQDFIASRRATLEAVFDIERENR